MSERGRDKTKRALIEHIPFRNLKKNQKAIKGGGHKRIGIPTKDISILMCISF